MTVVGTGDQPKRWSKALTTNMAGKQMNTTAMTICCNVRVSANGPACMRRSSAAGFVRIK